MTPPQAVHADLLALAEFARTAEPQGARLSFHSKDAKTRDLDEPFPEPVYWEPNWTMKQKSEVSESSGWTVSNPVKLVPDPADESKTIRKLNDGSIKDGDKPTQLVRSSQVGSENLPYSPWEVGAPVYPTTVGEGFALGPDTKGDLHSPMNPDGTPREISASWGGVGESNADVVGETGRPPKKATPPGVGATPVPPKGRVSPKQAAAFAAATKKHDHDVLVHDLRKSEQDRLDVASALLKSLPAKCKKGGAK